MVHFFHSSFVLETFSRSMPMADRISTLPDSIICHILSFLPTEQALATSVLSNRWRPLWLAIPSLNFDDESYLQNKDTYSCFLQLVYTVMLLRDGEQPIKRFSLKCASSFCSSSIVNTWVKAATQRKVEHLYLSLPSTISLPSCILTSKTLVVLKLCGLIVDSLSSVSFPSHKILHLRTVRFRERRYLVKILSACPALEVLLMKSLDYTNFFTIGQLELFQIQLPKLVKADISESFASLSFKPFYDVEFLRADVLLRDELPARKLFNLTYMELRFFNNYWNWFINLLNCPSLRSLVIDKMEESIRFRLSDDKCWVHPQSVPECLLSQLKRLCVRKYEGTEIELQFTRYIMHNARVLHNMTICCTGSSNPQEKLQMLKQLSLCPRGSVICQLHFE